MPGPGLNIEATVRNRIQDTVPKLKPTVIADGVAFVRIPIDGSDLPVPAIAHGLLVEVLDCQSGRGGDKTAWVVHFSWDGRTCALAYEKFGLRLYVASLDGEDKDAPRKAAQLIIKGLRRAISSFENEVLTPLAVTQLDAGEVSVQNQAPSLRGMYDHFRSRVEKAYASQPPPPTDGGLLPGISERLSWSLRRDQAASFDALAMVNAYFSLLEHTLALVLPFTDFDPGSGQLREFIREFGWREKFRTVYDINRNLAAKAVHDELGRASDTYRNPYSHGGFDKVGAAVYVHFPTMGGAPGSLNRFGESPHSGLFAVTEPRFRELCQCFDHADEFIRSEATRLPMMWVDAGLDVSFDAGSRGGYAEHMKDDRDFEGFIENTRRYQEAVMNFDI